MRCSRKRCYLSLLLMFAGVITCAQGIITRTTDSVKVKAHSYSWVWSSVNDKFTIYDSSKRRVVSGALQPVVLVNSGRNTPNHCSLGNITDVSISGDRLIIIYSHVNGNASLKISWRFEDHGAWFEPVEYSGNQNEDVVGLYYFSKEKNNYPVPALECYWLIQPGMSASAAISPVQVLSSRINFDTWLGRGSTIDNSRLLQQWGLPAHFFCGSNLPDRSSQISGLTWLMPAAFCCGLADLPSGDLRMVTGQGCCSPVIDIRSDLWGQVRGAGPWKLGATFYWSVAPDYRQAISGYYQALVHEGLISIKQNSVAKNEIMTRPVFNTWGAQLSMSKHSALLDQQALETIYKDLRGSGMNATAFVIDDKWEDEYGTLQHSPARLPQFNQFIDRLRRDSFKIGIWSAFFRCENPQLLGLDNSNMLLDIGGKAITKGAKPFFFLDISQVKVQEVLRKRIRQFMKQYHPDIVKFDFGYELPALSMSMPANHEWAGERMFKKSLDIIVPVLREENPDVVIMYYSLSPLFLEEFDLHSTDDLFMNEEEFSLEANRRLFFSSVLGEIGMPSYGSGGYSWKNMDDIWFDSSPSGSLGSLGSFSSNDNRIKLSDRDIAKFNGLSAIARKSNVFSIEPLNISWFGANGAHASSWIRFENGKAVLAALRTNPVIGTAMVKAEYKDQIHSDAMVVIASRDDKSLTETSHLGIVPFADGNIRIWHEGKSSSVKLKAHYTDGTQSSIGRYPVKKGWLQIPLSERSGSGKLVAWFQLDFAD